LLLEENQQVANNQMTYYSELNDTRMNRLDKTMIITDENIQQPKNLRGEYLVSYRRDGVVMLRNSADYKQNGC
jgi:hypothetical protein